MNQIISALIDKNAFGKDNVVTATYTVAEAGRIVTKVGEFGIVDIDREEDSINLTVKHIVEKNQIVINDDQITAIDGMEITRYADVYDIDVTGKNKKIGKKRGRKPKNAGN